MEVIFMMKSYSKKVAFEDKFARKYYACLDNHRSGVKKLKRNQRRKARRILNREIHKQIKETLL